MGPCGYVTTAASTEKKLQEAQGGGHLPERGHQTPAQRRGRGGGSEHAGAGGRAPDHPPTQSTPGQAPRARVTGPARARPAKQKQHECALPTRPSSLRQNRKESHFHLHIKLARSADTTPTFSHFTKSSNAFLADGYAESVPQPPARGPGRAWLT